MSDVKVILDVEIGHSVCPEDETEETCKLNKVSEAIQQELLKAKWEIVNMAKQRAEDDDVYTLQAFAEDMDTYLQAKLKGDDK